MKQNSPKEALPSNGSGSSISDSFVQKFRFSDGAALQHSQLVCQVSWILCLLGYAYLNCFYLRIVSGSYLQVNGAYQTHFLIDQLQFPLPIFQFPSWILIMGLFMCLLCTVPIIISQLYNLLYAIPFMLSIVVLGHKPILSLCVFMSCAGVSFEPFRFKSKYVAAMLSYIPIILYWLLYSGPNPEQDVLRWAVYYSPWGFAFLFSLIFLGIVVIAGHFSRYWPAIIPPIVLAAIALTIGLFNHSIGLDERDFQAQVYRFRPDKNPDLAGESIVPYLMKELKEIKKSQAYLSDEALLTALRTEWKWTFNYNLQQNSSPSSLARKKLVSFEQARLKAIQQIDGFIVNHSKQMPQDSRLVDAIYFKGLLNDLRPDISALSDEDILRFYYDRPSAYSEPIWQDILERFVDSVVAIDARRRLAILAASRLPKGPEESFGFDKAIQLLDNALDKIKTVSLEPALRYRADQFWYERFDKLFIPPAPSIDMDTLKRLEIDIKNLKRLLGTENRTGHTVNDVRLARFIALDPRRLEYEESLKKMINESPNPDPLRDNLELALARLMKNEEDKIARLKEIVREFPDTDGAQLAQELLAESVPANGR